MAAILSLRQRLVAPAVPRDAAVEVIDPADEESHYWGEIERNLRAIDIWIGEEADLGRGYGTQMMALALDRCFADPAVSGTPVL